MFPNVEALLNEPAARTLALAGLNDELRGQRFQVGSRISLGRSIQSDIFLPDPTIARHHCQIEKTPQGLAIYLTAPGAMLFVNGRSVRNASLVAGDRIELGRFLLRVIEDGQSPHQYLEPLPSTNNSRQDVAETGQQAVVLTLSLAPRAVAKITASDMCRQVALFFEHAQQVAQRHHGQLLQGAFFQRQILWNYGGNSVEEHWETSLRASLHLANYAFVSSRPVGEFVLSQGLAFGVVGTHELLSGESVGWGEAIDRSTRLAIQAAGAIRFEEWPPGCDDLALCQQEGMKAHTLKAVPLSSQGRRAKWDLSLPVVLSHFGFQIPAMLLRVMHDPETDKLTLSFLCESPVEVEQEYLMATPNGKTMSLNCDSSRQAPMHSVQAQFTCLASNFSIEELLGGSEMEFPFESSSLAA